MRVVEIQASRLVPVNRFLFTEYGPCNVEGGGSVNNWEGDAYDGCGEGVSRRDYFCIVNAEVEFEPCLDDVSGFTLVQSCEVTDGCQQTWVCPMSPYNSILVLIENVPCAAQAAVMMTIYFVCCPITLI